MDNTSQYHIQICVEARNDILDVQYTKGATVQHVLETACKTLGIDDSWNYALYSKLLEQWLSESYSYFEEEMLLLRKKTPEYYRLASGSQATGKSPVDNENFWSNCFNRAVEKLRNEIALPHLGVIYDHVVIMTSSKTKFIITVQYLPYSSKDELASEIVKSGILKWKSLDELNAIYAKDSCPIWTNYFSFWCSRKSRLSPGLYVGLLHTESSLQSLRVLVQKDRKQFIPLEKIRDEASISSEEASWIKSLSRLNPDEFGNLVDSIKDTNNENENSLALTKFQRAFVESYYKLQSDTKLMWDSGDIYGEHTVDVYYNQETRQMFSILEDLNEGQCNRITEMEPSGAIDSGGKPAASNNERANTTSPNLTITSSLAVEDSQNMCQGQIPKKPFIKIILLVKPMRQPHQLRDLYVSEKHTFYPFSLFDALQHSTLNASLYSSSRRAMQILHASQGYFSRELVRRLHECNITLDNSEGNGMNFDDCLLDPQVLGSLPDIVKSIKSALDIIREETILLKNQWNTASWSMSVIEWDRQRTMGRYNFDQPLTGNKCSFGRSTCKHILRKGAQTSQAIVPLAKNLHTSTIDTFSRIGFLLETMKHAPDRAWNHICSINAPIPIVRFGKGDTFITKAKLDPILANFLASTLFVDEERDDDVGEVDKCDMVKVSGKVDKKGKLGMKKSRKTETKKKASRKNIMRSLGFGSGKNGNDISNTSGDNDSSFPAEDIKKPASRDLSKMKMNGELSKIDRDTLSKSYFSPLTFSLPSMSPLFLDEDNITNYQNFDEHKTAETSGIPVKDDKRVEPELSDRRMYDAGALIKSDITTQRDYLNDGLSDVSSCSSSDSSAPVSNPSTLTPISINVSANPFVPALAIPPSSPKTLSPLPPSPTPSSPRIPPPTPTEAKLASPQPTTPTNSLTVVMDYFSHVKKKDRAQSPAPSPATPDGRDVRNDGSINHPNSGNATSIGSAGSDERPTNSLALFSSTTEREGLNRTTNSLTQNNKISNLNLDVQTFRKTGGLHSKSAPSSPSIKRFNAEPFPFAPRVRQKGAGDLNEEDKCESEKINKTQNDPLMNIVTPVLTTKASSTRSLSTFSDPQQKQTLHSQTSSSSTRDSQKSSTFSSPVISRTGISLNAGIHPFPFTPKPPLPSPALLAKLESREDLRKMVADEKIGGKNEIERPNGIINGSGEDKGEKLENVETLKGLPDKYRRRERIIRMWKEASLEGSSMVSEEQYEKLMSSSLQRQQQSQQQTVASGRNDDGFSFRSPTSPTCFTSPNSPTSSASHSPSQSLQLFSDDSSLNRMRTTRARAKSVSEAYQKRQKSERKFRENVFAS
ncbi:4585_t:CDS:2 [Paraglomus occultum]|uniref:4585_t:CDS:1 n=1 Tax=Paraglomus occultum TaxID=144539 RepID=A0A9N8ZA24_9GLOM|nr:4585_t:CDS:2 [Paraglomus occultum]